MRTRISRLTRAVLCLSALFLSAWTPTEVGASSISFLSHGNIPPLTGGGTPSPITFQDLSNGSIDGNAPFLLGNFVVQNPSPSVSVNYSNTPVDIGLFARDGQNLHVFLTLNGTLGNGQSPLAVVQSVSIPYVIPVGGPPWTGPPWTAPTSFDGIPINQIRVGGPIVLDPSLNHGVIPVYAQVVPVPEPSLASMALLVAGGLGFRRWRRGSRPAEPARA